MGVAGRRHPSRWEYDITAQEMLRAQSQSLSGSVPVLWLTMNLKGVPTRCKDSSDHLANL